MPKGGYLGGSTIVRIPLVGSPRKALESPKISIEATFVRPKGAKSDWLKEELASLDDPEIVERAAERTRERWRLQKQKQQLKLRERLRLKKAKSKKRGKSKRKAGSNARP